MTDKDKAFAWEVADIMWPMLDALVYAKDPLPQAMRIYRAVGAAMERVAEVAVKMDATRENALRAGLMAIEEVMTEDGTTE